MLGSCVYDRWVARIRSAQRDLRIAGRHRQVCTSLTLLTDLNKSIAFKPIHELSGCCYVYHPGRAMTLKKERKKGVPNSWGQISDAFVWRLSVAYIGSKSRTERPRKTKIGTGVAHVTRDSDITFKVKRSKVKVTRPLWLVVLTGQHGHNGNGDLSICVHDVYRVTTCRLGGAYRGSRPLTAGYCWSLFHAPIFRNHSVVGLTCPKVSRGRTFGDCCLREILLHAGCPSCHPSNGGKAQEGIPSGEFK